MYEITVKHIGLPNGTVHTHTIVAINKKAAHEELDGKYSSDQYRIVSEGRVK